MEIKEVKVIHSREISQISTKQEAGGEGLYSLDHKSERIQSIREKQEAGLQSIGRANVQLVVAQATGALSLC
jgi:hypothetical protein